MRGGFACGTSFGPNCGSGSGGSHALRIASGTLDPTGVGCGADGVKTFVPSCGSGSAGSQELRTAIGMRAPISGGF
jgi:hypothetical protein